jgi:hypothetical protein
MAVILNPEFGSQDVAVSMGVRMLKHPTMTMEQILNFIDSEMIVEAPVQEVSTPVMVEDTVTEEVEVSAVQEVDEVEEMQPLADEVEVEL